jgi:glycosyltransferase involved in cell wall biosynthesis
MTPLRLVSITHPDLGGVVGAKRLDLLANSEVTILTPHEGGDVGGATGTVRRISMPTRGRQRSARFPSLAAALNLLNPHVVHLHADPDTRLALQVARVCGRHTGRGLVLETELDPAGAARGWTPSVRARRTLSRTNAVIARSACALSWLRRLGFDGLGVIAGHGLEPEALADSGSARRLLHIPPGPEPVIGWSGPLATRSHVADLLEAVALCGRDVVVVIPAAGPAYHDVLDRADALEVLHRVRFVAPERAADVGGERPDLSAFPTMLAAIDALLVAPADGAFDRASCLRAVELAHVHAIPVIHPALPDIAEMVGDGGWQVPFGDPALLARLFDELQARPLLLAAATSAAAANAATRHSPQAAAAELARAITAAAAASSEGPTRSHGRKLRDALGLALRRQPGST